MKPSEHGQLSVELLELRQRLYALERQLATSASRSSDSLPPGEMAEILVCDLGSRRVAFLLRDVIEVVPVAATVALPEAPPWMVGMLDLRGEILPVFDVEARLTRRARSIALGDQIVVCSDGARRAGLLLHGIHDVRRIDAASVRRDVTDAPHGPYLLGVLPDETGAVLVLSVRRLLDASEVALGEPSSEVT
jgi:purine-binding chemotaxis protein CheW